ncbi:hypothetical protein AAG565_14065 [Fontimonas sp. SYSU GA230001]|uniref:hypothetical protein n=1 Tax=Fontimonas sp. SYSU GA230001 TaxID=3142450 RepID=UPI0032B3D98C
MRVNARLEGEYEKQMEFLTHATGMGVTDVIKTSIAHYYESVRGGEKPRFRHLRAAAGRYGSGRSDVSSRTKDSFAESLTAKHRGRRE